MIKRWSIRENTEPAAVENLSAALNVSPVIARLLVQRSIRNFDEAKLFFRPDLSLLHDPFLMKDMDKAVNRIDAAMASHEKILIYGDYDVDGTTAVALVYSFLKTLYPHLAYYIPDRYKEGYGISFAGIDYAKENGYSLIIALDCGIKSIDKVAYASERNIDFIICDHHRPGAELPVAVAVLDPKRSDCSYPYDELSGCGIGFKLAQAYALHKGIAIDTLECYLDLVAVSIGADIVPITGENRILAYHGLKRINSNPRQGFRTILSLLKVKKELTITDLVFMIAPRINAAGRVESGTRAVDLLVAENEEAAQVNGLHINQNNTDRRDLDMTITQHALLMIENNPDMQKRKSTVVFHAEWHKGVVGIVASRLTERYYRPTIVLTQSDGLITGSARSVKDFDVYEAIDACSELLVQFGGHKYAAGLTMKPENLEAFVSKFEMIVSSTIEEHLLTPEIEIDAVIGLEEIDMKLHRILKQFAPFGPGNMAPVFMSKNLSDRGYARIVGNNHLKLDVLNSGNPKQVIAAIAFGQGEHLDSISRKIPFDMCYSLEENEYNGVVSLQLNVKDIKV
ncbi:MAG TPA: single-stranded-DNA-specific exonuclease RecJ [Bacteroidia bacterium]|jgi:single-stranded-DNA-specific exonuclease|nr:single-stranded-DNA-specific exonuclease RecJ [Bacteroidia bacterium]